ncbi:MAG: TIGR02281 family clan AA aspartic protease [Salinarimonadaceae bacterium]|nr:MAG: TIGR02281 family clan AA aspartic protease [Salinarimonadaceae bacterium]
MPGAIGLGIILVAIAILAFSYGERNIVGLEPDQFARLTALGAMLLFLAGSVFGRSRVQIGEALRALVIWAAIFIALLGLYVYRFEMDAVFGRVVDGVIPGRTTISSPGEVSVTRGASGGFVVQGEANGEPMRFIFDTGADVVVLTAESAARIGFQPQDLRYIVQVRTANGTAMAAPVTIETLTVGDIAASRVRALVARPDALTSNLLGMSFLDRLSSYEVRNDRLILRGGD